MWFRSFAYLDDSPFELLLMMRPSHQEFSCGVNETLFTCLLSDNHIQQTMAAAGSSHMARLGVLVEAGDLDGVIDLCESTQLQVSSYVYTYIYTNCHNNHVIQPCHYVYNNTHNILHCERHLLYLVCDARCSASGTCTTHASIVNPWFSS